MLAGALKADSEEQVPEMNVSYKYSSPLPPHPVHLVSLRSAVATV